MVPETPVANMLLAVVDVPPTYIVVEFPLPKYIVPLLFRVIFPVIPLFPSVNVPVVKAPPILIVPVVVTVLNRAMVAPAVAKAVKLPVEVNVVPLLPLSTREPEPAVLPRVTELALVTAVPIEIAPVVVVLNKVMADPTGAVPLTGPSEVNVVPVVPARARAPEPVDRPKVNELALVRLVPIEMAPVVVVLNNWTLDPTGPVLVKGPSEVSVVAVAPLNTMDPELEALPKDNWPVKMLPNVIFPEVVVLNKFTAAVFKAVCVKAPEPTMENKPVPLAFMVVVPVP
jgi:hypothetical protein